jgi:hypothetical protein
VRDATDLKVDAKHGAWWDGLPDSGEHAWADRAKRRRRRDCYRLALVTSKFRLGEEPNPFCLEVHHDTAPWTVENVTAEVEAQLEETKRAAADAQQIKIDLAVQALVARLPIIKNPDAIEWLKAHGFSRDRARQIIADRMDRDWVQTGSGSKIDPYMLKSPAGTGGLRSHSRARVCYDLIPATPVAQEPQESQFKSNSLPTVSRAADSCGQFHVIKNAESNNGAAMEDERF